MSRRRQAGFSLLEVLVAFAILAVSLGVLMQIFSRATITTITTAQYSRAAALAQARLAAVGSAIPLKEGPVSGDPEDGFAWQIGIVPVELGETPTASGLSDVVPAVTAYRVTVTALWQEGARVRRLTLSTLRLGEPAQ
ncbi:prepilin-type N-terminal cleavage/methylation domain-containing protein [uncultured Thiodictyon sp.]|uniref:type IV pilus modification PilV family protein n=1 Tax=uncultured Thiodictyon sp. TaxID=1846217 RepID=UPI0025F2FD52|nr:prepilin-type N-terminal cleavage/methylation domain-containing protein [uncultured Thiodictyon sp.]